MDASGAETSWERIGELASQLSACAADLERFLAVETSHLQALHGHQDEQAEVARHFHPGRSDPALAALLTRFEQLEAAATEFTERGLLLLRRSRRFKNVNQSVIPRAARDDERLRTPADCP